MPIVTLSAPVGESASKHFTLSQPATVQISGSVWGHTSWFTSATDTCTITGPDGVVFRVSKKGNGGLPFSKSLNLKAGTYTISIAHSGDHYGAGDCTVKWTDPPPPPPPVQHPAETQPASNPVTSATKLISDLTGSGGGSMTKGLLSNPMVWVGVGVVAYLLLK